MRGNRNQFYKAFFYFSIYTFHTGWTTVPDGERKVFRHVWFVCKLSVLKYYNNHASLNVTKAVSPYDICSHDKLFKKNTCLLTLKQKLFYINFIIEKTAERTIFTHE